MSKLTKTSGTLTVKSGQLSGRFLMPGAHVTEKPSTDFEDVIRNTELNIKKLKIQNHIYTTFMTHRHLFNYLILSYLTFLPPKRQ